LIKVLLSQRSATLGELPYRKRDYLLTAAERSFYEVLHKAVGEEMHVFPKARLADLVWLPKGTKNPQAHWNRIMSEHVDFVLCDRQSVSPVLAIELDDSSHQMSHRQERDSFVNQVFHAASLPVLRIPAKRSYAPNELAELIHKEIRQEGAKNPR